MFDLIEPKPISVVSAQHYPQDGLPEFVFLGRSNVGKSSFLNALTGRKNLAFTSQSPGKTQTLNFFRVPHQCYLVDVPGYGYARVSKQARERFGVMIEEYLTTRETLKHLYLLMDMRHLPSEDDRLMVDYLRYLERPFTVILTKADKLSNNEQFRQKQNIMKVLTMAPEEVIAVSATKGLNIATIQAQLNELITT